jgi:hypothetical protein
MEKDPTDRGGLHSLPKNATPYRSRSSRKTNAIDSHSDCSLYLPRAFTVGSHAPSMGSSSEGEDLTVVRQASPRKEED